jgi:hypothetical protein
MPQEPSLPVLNSRLSHNLQLSMHQEAAAGLLAVFMRGLDLLYEPLVLLLAPATGSAFDRIVAAHRHLRHPAQALQTILPLKLLDEQVSYRGGGGKPQMHDLIGRSR